MPSAFFERLRWWLAGKKTLPKAQEARATFAQEHADISADFDELLRSYRLAMTELGKARRRLPDEDLLHHAADIEQTYHALRRALRRATVAALPTRTLLDEWREWDHFQERAGDNLHPLQAERREMLRSELALRGALLDRQKSLPEPSAVPSRIELPSPELDVAEAIVEAQTMPSFREPATEFDEFDRYLAPTFASTADAWDEAFAEFTTSADLDQVRLAEYAKARRQAHALKKRWQALTVAV
jgi:hypothetical protein